MRLDLVVLTMKAGKRLLELGNAGEKMPLNTVASKSHEVSGQTKMEDCRIESTGVERAGDLGK